MSWLDGLKRFGRWLSPSTRKMRVMVAVALAFGGAIFLTVWHSHTARLEIEGQNLAWAVLVAFGVVWAAPRRELRGIAGLILGVSFGFTALYGLASLDFLPLTPIAVGMSLGVAGAVATCVCYLFARQFSFGGVAVGYGLALGAAVMTGFGPTTSGGDLLGVGVATVMAAIFGGVAAEMMRRIVDVAAQPAARIAEIIHLPGRHVHAEHDEFAHGAEQEEEAEAEAMGWEGHGAKRLADLVTPRRRQETKKRAVR